MPRAGDGCLPAQASGKERERHIASPHVGYPPSDEKSCLSGSNPIADIQELLHLQIMRLLAAARSCVVVLWPTSAFAGHDARAKDAADAFSQLCLSMFIGGKSGADPERFAVTELDEATRQQIKPDIKASELWDVYAKASDTSMLVHYEPQGMCVVEIAEADEVSMKEAVARVTAGAASSLDTTAVAHETVTRQVEGLTATTSSWGFPSAQGDVLVMVTTLPQSKFMIQHVVTVSYVR